jgi:hypothetical protein
VQAAHIGFRATMTKDEHSFEQALDVALGGDLGAGRLGHWVRLEEPVAEAFSSVTQTLRAVCAGELSLEDVTSAGAGRLFAEGAP